MIVPWAPTQSPRSSSFTSSNEASPITPFDANSCTCAPRSRIVAKTNLPVSRSNMTRPATVTSSPVSAPGSSAPHSRRTSASVCERSNRYGYGSSPRLRNSSTRARRRTRSAANPLPTGSVPGDSLTTATVVGGLRRDTLRLLPRRSLAASCRVRPPIWRPIPARPSRRPCRSRRRRARHGSWRRSGSGASCRAAAPRSRAPRFASIPVSTTLPSSSTCRTSTARSWLRPSLLPSRRARPRRRRARLRSDCGRSRVPARSSTPRPTGS